MDLSGLLKWIEDINKVAGNVSVTLKSRSYGGLGIEVRYSFGGEQYGYDYVITPYQLDQSQEVGRLVFDKMAHEIGKHCSACNATSREK